MPQSFFLLKQPLLILLSLVLFDYSLSAQTAFGSVERIDSLKSELSHVTNDTSKVYIYLELSYNYSLHHSDSSILIAQEGIKLAKNGIQATTKKSVKERLIELSSLCSESIADQYRLTSSYSKAIGYYRTAIDGRKKIHLAGCAYVYNKMAMCHAYLKNYPEALEICYLSLEESDTILNKTKPEYVVEYQTLNIVSSIHHRVENWEKAIEYYTKSIPVIEKAHHNRGRANLYNNLAIAHKKLEQYNKAVKYFHLALAEDQALEPKQLILVQSNLSSALIELSKFKEAEKLLAIALEKSNSLEDNTATAIVYGRMAELAFTLGKTELAEMYCEKSMNLTDKLPDDIFQLTTSILMKINEQKKNWEEAYNYQQLHSKVSENIVNLEMLRDVINTESNHARLLFTKKNNYMASQKEILLKEAHKKAESEKRKNQQHSLITIVSICCLIGVLIITFFWIKYMRNKIKEKEKIAESELKILLKEINLLRSNLNTQLIESIPVDADLINNNLEHLMKTSLTNREMAVLIELCKGKENKSIADSLFISVNTVRTHLLKIYDKLEVHNRTQAVKKAENLARLNMDM